VARVLYRFQFDEHVDPSEVEGTLHLAVFAAEGIRGQAQVRLDASYDFDREKRTCTIDAGSEAGRDIVRIFTGLLLREYDEGAFRVRKRAE